MMKLIYSSLIFFLIFNSSCTQTETGAVKYNDQMMIQQDSIVTLIDSLDQLIIIRDTNSLVGFQNNIINILNQKIDLVNSTPAPEGGENYKAAVINLFESYRNIVQDKYSKIISISLMSQINLENDTIERFNQLINEINNEFALNLDKFLIVQKEFAEKNKFSLVEDIKQ